MRENNLKAHLALLFATSMWGLMSPVGKAAMEAGITGLILANMRMLGGAICFWITALFVKHESVPRKDLLLMCCASMLGIVCNQGCFTFGLSLTSPVDASIITTTMPIFTLILAAVFLKEKVTARKVSGLLLGSTGALVLILTASTATSGKASNIWGDLLCMSSQISFALYLTIFKNLIARYSVFTLMKWMFSFAAVAFLPFSWHDIIGTDFTAFSWTVWMEVGFVVIFATYLAYIFILYGQKHVRPTVVSMYNYMQPIVGSAVAVWMGLSDFGWSKAIAAIFIFVGVYLVTQSKSTVNHK